MNDNPNSTHIKDNCSEPELHLNAYVVTRIVYEIIKLYMMNNPPKTCGVQLSQTYDPDYTKSKILLEIAYNWKTKDMSKVPAVFIQREAVELKAPTLGQEYDSNPKNASQRRFVWNSMPVTITCVAAEPLAVVENLAEYVKQPLLYFRKEIQKDFGIRQFKLVSIGKPKLLSEAKNNFSVDILVDITFDEGWIIKRESLKIKRIGVELFDSLMNPLDTLQI
jgi:hypothetical protein